MNEFAHSASYDLEYSDYEAMPDRGGADYHCSLVAMASQQEFRPRRATPKPFMKGPQTAVVVGPAGGETDLVLCDGSARTRMEPYVRSRVALTRSRTIAKGILR